ncbi:MAG TPA: pitrilysin family protein [Allosphingosinicella sp.]|jgi:predicted Zn-dependent peptidase
MIRRLITATLAAALAAAPVAAGAQAYPPQPKPAAPKPFKVPASQTFRLANGMEVTLIPYGSVPKAVVSLRIAAGSLNEAENTWLASLTSQMLREGAAARTGAQIAEAAAGMGSSLSVGSDRHETSLALNVLSEHSADAIRLIADVARRPTFPTADFERVRQNMLRSLAVARSQPQSAADVALLAAYYGTSHPYGRAVPTEAQLRAYTLEDVRRFYQENFGAKRARLYIAGRFDAARVSAAVRQAFGDWAPGRDRLKLAPQPKQGPQVLLVDRPGAPQSTVRLAFPAPVAGSRSDIPFRVTNALLGGSFTSRITRNLREDKGYTYSPSSGTTLNAGEALWTFNGDITTEVTGAALKEIFSEVRRLQNEAPPAEEATGMRTWMAGTFVLANASPSGLINSIATRDFHGLPANWLDNYVPGVLAVESAAMRDAARERFPLEKMTLVIVGDLAKVEPQLRTLPELQGMEMKRVNPF